MFALDSVSGLWNVAYQSQSRIHVLMNGSPGNETARATSGANGHVIATVVTMKKSATKRYSVPEGGADTKLVEACQSVCQLIARQSRLAFAVIETISRAQRFVS